MTKFIPMLVVLMILGLLFPGMRSMAETTVLSESFENGFPPSGWKMINNGFILDTWRASSWKVHSGLKSANAEAEYTTLDHWLVTSEIDLSSATHAFLYFYEDEEGWASSGSHHYIKVSTSSQTNTSSFTTVLDMTPSNHDIVGFQGGVVQVDLSAYVGNSTVYVAFHIQGNDSWFIDDVTVTTSNDHDVRAVRVNMDRHYAPNSLVTPTGTVSNVGNNTETFDVDFGYYNWDGSLNVLSTKTVSGLAAGASTEGTFDAFTLGDYEREFFVKTKLTGDYDQLNDITSILVNTFSDKKSMVVVEKGTGTWCQYCPGAAFAVDSLHKVHHDSVAVIANHNGDDYTTTESDYRNDYYDITGFPTTIFGGQRRKVGGASCGNDWTGIFDAYETLYYEVLNEYTGLEMTELGYVEDGETITATSRTTYLKSSYCKTDRIFFVLTESHIYDEWDDCIDSLHFVMRKMYPDSTGQVFYDGTTAPTQGMVVENQVSFTIPSGVVKDNCELVAFVQEPTTKEIKAAAVVPLDGSVSAIPGESAQQLPKKFQLLQNYPNPFNPITNIRFILPQQEKIELAVFDASGKKIRTLVSGRKQAGAHTVTFDASSLASGVYFYQLKAGQFSITKKMLLIK